MLIQGPERESASFVQLVEAVLRLPALGAPSWIFKLVLWPNLCRAALLGSVSRVPLPLLHWIPEITLGFPWLMQGNHIILN